MTETLKKQRGVGWPPCCAIVVANGTLAHVAVGPCQCPGVGLCELPIKAAVSVCDIVVSTVACCCVTFVSIVLEGLV